tara:strand:- start:812 stop:1423 length:612 start_codon:yes stop_codon:yes gene_type:complete
MKIICIGRNYADHAKELNNDIPEEPLFFMKPDTALLQEGNPFYIPEFTNEVHHELEIVLKISKVGKHIEEKFAHKYYQQIGLGIDFTARDVQRVCKEKGLPWEKAKAFDGSAPLGQFVDKETLGDLSKLSFQLEKNGELVQQGDTSLMLFPFDQLIAHISKYVTLKTGDLIYTGTPAGVGPVQIGDVLVGYLGDEKMIEVPIK